MFVMPEQLYIFKSESCCHFICCHILLDNMFLHSPLNLDLVILWILNFEFVLLFWGTFFTIWGPFCYLFIHLGDPFGRYGGPFCNFFSLLETFLPCGRLSATFFSIWGPFWTCPPTSTKFVAGAHVAYTPPHNI